MSNAIAGVGTIFHKWVPASSAWVKVAEITNIAGPSMTRDTEDVTTLDSTNGYREFIASFRDGGTVVLSMNYTRTGYELMKDDFESNSLQNYEVVLPDVDKTSLEFEGLVTEFPLTIAPEKISLETIIKISGAVTLNSGSGSGA